MWNPNGFGSSTANVAIPRVPLVWSCYNFVCVFVFVFVFVSSVCELQMPAPPNVALQLPHFGRVPSNRNHKNQKTTDKVTGSWKCLQCPSLQTLQIWIRTWWPPGAKATKLLACIEDWTGYDRLWQAIAKVLMDAKYANDWDVQSPWIKMVVSSQAAETSPGLATSEIFENSLRVTSCHVVSRLVWALRSNSLSDQRLRLPRTLVFNEGFTSWSDTHGRWRLSLWRARPAPVQIVTGENDVKDDEKWWKIMKDVFTVSFGSTVSAQRAAQTHQFLHRPSLSSLGMPSWPNGPKPNLGRAPGAPLHFLRVPWMEHDSSW